MKKTIYTIISFVLIFMQFKVNVGALDVSAQSAVLIDAYSGKIVYEKNAHTRLGMASTTKIMTALTALTEMDISTLDENVKISDKAIGIEGSSIYLTKGEMLSMRQLLYALLLQSANDAATAIAIEVSGSIEEFANLMNDKAKDMGLCNSNFTNPHGLYDENHYTTAYELAIITKNALENDIFKEMVQTQKTVIPLNNNEGKRVLVNHNKLLKIYDGAIGVKTGFTKKTGRCLVSAAQRGDTTLIAVTLNAPNDWNDHKNMLDEGFDKIVTHTLAKPNSLNYNVPVVGGNTDYLTVTNIDGLKYTCEKDSCNITSELILSRFLFAPITNGEVIGQAVFYNNGKEIGRVDLISQTEITLKPEKKKLFGLF